MKKFHWISPWSGGTLPGEKKPPIFDTSIQTKVQNLPLTESIKQSSLRKPGVKPKRGAYTIPNHMDHTINRFAALFEDTPPSWDNRMLSLIDLLWIKADWHWSTICAMISLSLLTRILAMILKSSLVRKIERKAGGVEGNATSGTSTMKAFLVCFRRFPSLKKSMMAATASTPTIGHQVLKKWALNPSGPWGLVALNPLWVNILLIHQWNRFVDTQNFLNFQNTLSWLIFDQVKFLP